MEGNVQIRCGSLIIQICEAEDIQILKSVVSRDHVHLHIEYRPSQNISNIVKLFKRRASRKLQIEFPEFKQRYWGRHFWAIGFGCWSIENITDEKHHQKPNDNGAKFILE